MIRPWHELQTTTTLEGVSCVFVSGNDGDFWHDHPDLCALLGDRGPFTQNPLALSDQELRRNPKAVIARHPMLYGGFARSPGEVFLLDGRPEDARLLSAGLVKRLSKTR